MERRAHRWSGQSGSGARALLVLALSASLGCAGSMTRAQEAYQQGRYLEVAEGLAARERDLPDGSDREQAQYGMYLGLSLLRMGDTDGARRWLQFAYEVFHASPRSLTREQVGVLQGGWAELQRRGLVGAPPNARGAPPPRG